jgi:hypothetical protein
MSDRTFAGSESAQRRAAAIKSGALSETRVAPLSRGIYQRLRRRVSRASGPTHPVQRLRLELLARVLARIQLADQWFVTQPHELFRDPAAGEVHALVDRYMGWVAGASRMVDRLGEAGTPDDDLPALAARVRRD